MTLAESIFAKLGTEGSATAALVGTGAACKVFPGEAADAVEGDYVVQDQVGSSPDVTFGEASGSSNVLVQFSCVASTYKGARDLAAAVVADLDNQTLAGGEVCIECSEQDGFSQATDQFLRIVEATFFAPATAPA